MKIKNKALALVLATVVLTACSTTMTTKTVTKPNGEVVVTKEFKTSKNHSVMKALQTAATVVFLSRLDGGTGMLLESAVELRNNKEKLEFEREKFEFEQRKESLNHSEKI